MEAAHQGVDQLYGTWLEDSQLQFEVIPVEDDEPVYGGGSTSEVPALTKIQQL